MGNAIKFTEVGEVELKVELLERTNEKAKLQFTVRDSGIGMTKDQSAKLFQPFSQADSSMSRKYGGTGLGLSIVYRLVEMMSGQIWMDSEPGKGSRFQFTAVVGAAPAGVQQPERPADLQALAAALENANAPARRRGLRVLVAEDNPVNQRVILGLLKKRGHDVSLVTTGRQAVDAVGRERFDLVLMDMQMPEMDGFQATREIRVAESGGAPRHKIVAMTAHAMSGDREKCLTAGMDEYLSKPIRREELDALLENCLQLTAPRPTGGQSSPGCGTSRHRPPLRGSAAGDRFP